MVIVFTVVVESLKVKDGKSVVRLGEDRGCDVVLSDVSFFVFVLQAMLLVALVDSVRSLIVVEEFPEDSFMS